MALHHKHAPICPISRALCRLMDIFAEGLFLDEADAHLKVSQLFERLNCYSVEAKKRYNLDSEKNLLADHGIVSYTAPTDLEEVLMKRLKMIEKKDAMKKKKEMREKIKGNSMILGLKAMRKNGGSWMGVVIQWE